MPMGVERRVYEGDTAQPIKPQLLTIALALLFADILAVLLLQAGGLFFGRRAARAGTAALAALAIAATVLLALPGPADAQSTAPAPAPAPRARADDARAIQATAKVTFGYVLSGDAATDEASRQGLAGLGRFLIERTAVEPGEPFAVNILNDEIVFFPMLYWPVLANARAAAGGGAHQDRRLHEAGRHDRVRHQGLRPGHPDRASRCAARAARRCSACWATSTSPAWSPCPSTTC